MAKLSARGRYQIAEAVREYTAEQIQDRHECGRHIPVGRMHQHKCKGGR
jgi:hypothetical protein